MQKRKSDMRAEKEKHLREVIASCKEHLQNYKIARATNLGGKGWLGEQIRKHRPYLPLLVAVKTFLGRWKRTLKNTQMLRKELGNIDR